MAQTDDLTEVEKTILVEIIQDEFDKWAMRNPIKVQQAHEDWTFLVLGRGILSVIHLPCLAGVALRVENPHCGVCKARLPEHLELMMQCS